MAGAIEGALSQTFPLKGPIAELTSGGRARSWSLGSAPARASFLSTSVASIDEVQAALPPVAGTMKTTDGGLLTKVVQERRAQEESLTMKRLESFKMSKFIDDEEDLLTLEKTYRTPSTYSPEQMKYIKSQVLSKLNGEENRLNEKIKLTIKPDKRFSNEVNEFIERELYKRVHDLKYHIYVRMEKHQSRLNELGIFDEQANHVRIRSLFKVELQKLVDSVEQIFKEVVTEVEIKHGLSSPSTTQPADQTRKNRRSGVYLEQLRKYRSEQMQPRKHSKSVGSGTAPFASSTVEADEPSLPSSLAPPRLEIPQTSSRPSSARLAPLSPSLSTTIYPKDASRVSTPLSSAMTGLSLSPAVSQGPESPPRIKAATEDEEKEEEEEEEEEGEEEEEEGDGKNSPGV